MNAREMRDLQIQCPTIKLSFSGSVYMTSLGREKHLNCFRYCCFNVKLNIL